MTGSTQETIYKVQTKRILQEFTQRLLLVLCLLKRLFRSNSHAGWFRMRIVQLELGRLVSIFQCHHDIPFCQFHSSIRNTKLKGNLSICDAEEDEGYNRRTRALTIPITEVKTEPFTNESTQLSDISRPLCYSCSYFTSTHNIITSYKYSAISQFYKLLQSAPEGLRHSQISK